MTGVRIERQVEHPSAGVAWSGRVWVPGGHTTTIHVARYALDHVRVRVHRIDPPEPVEDWCRSRGIDEAINGGFFTKPELEPLGELVSDGARQRSTSFVPPWDRRRGALHVARDGGVRCAPLAELEAAMDARDDLLQAAPLLVRGGRVVVAHDDPEGLRTTCEEFDSDISDGPYPRMAIAVGEGELIAASADGRGEQDDGLTLPEWALVLQALGAREALNLDGGSSSAIVTAATRRNSPRDDQGELLDDGYPTPTVISFTDR